MAFFYVPGVQLRYTLSSLYVPIRWTTMNMIDIYNETMNGIVGASSGNRTLVFHLKGQTYNSPITAVLLSVLEANSWCRV